jgi:hypothetical protein
VCRINTGFSLVQHGGQTEQERRLSLCQMAAVSFPPTKSLQKKAPSGTTTLLAFFVLVQPAVIGRCYRVVEERIKIKIKGMKRAVQGKKSEGIWGMKQFGEVKHYRNARASDALSSSCLFFPATFPSSPFLSLLRTMYVCVWWCSFPVRRYYSAPGWLWGTLRSGTGDPILPTR